MQGDTRQHLQVTLDQELVKTEEILIQALNNYQKLIYGVPKCVHLQLNNIYYSSYANMLYSFSTLAAVAKTDVETLVEELLKNSCITDIPEDSVHPEATPLEVIHYADNVVQALEDVYLGYCSDTLKKVQDLEYNRALKELIKTNRASSFLMSIASANIH